MNKKSFLIFFLIFCLVGIGIAGYLGYQSSTQQVSSILGVQDSKLSEPNSSTSSRVQPPSLISAITKPLLVSQQNLYSLSSSSQSVRLVGEGCEQNSAFDKTCSLEVSNGSRYTLKKCSETNFDTCNFYEFQLGSNNGDQQYIIQRYEENGDILVDILEYTISSNSLKTTKTVLFQTLSDGSAEAKNGNTDFTNTLNQFQ
jgi:hypothetical protein